MELPHQKTLLIFLWIHKDKTAKLDLNITINKTKLKIKTILKINWFLRWLLINSARILQTLKFIRISWIQCSILKTVRIFKKGSITKRMNLTIRKISFINKMKMKIYKSNKQKNPSRITFCKNVKKNFCRVLALK